MRENWHGGEGDEMSLTKPGASQHQTQRKPNGSLALNRMEDDGCTRDK